jgi:membrane associated rhomboid family serine protease
MDAARWTFCGGREAIGGDGTPCGGGASYLWGVWRLIFVWLGCGAGSRQMGERAVVLLPVYDHNRLRHISFQYVTVSLIIANVVVFFVFQSGLSNSVVMTSFVTTWGLTPGQVLTAGSENPDVAVGYFHAGATLITYMFLHGGVMHLGGNMLFLWVFGDNVEDAMGHMKFLAFYLSCGVFGGLTHIAVTPSSTAQLIGASGAVAGVIAAYLVLHPNVRVWVLAFYRIPLRVNAVVVLGLWIAMQIFYAVTIKTGNVAFWAHVGGIIAGALLVVVMRNPDVPLFDWSTGLEETEVEPEVIPERQTERQTEDRNRW